MSFSCPLLSLPSLPAWVSTLLSSLPNSPGNISRKWNKTLPGALPQAARWSCPLVPAQCPGHKAAWWVAVGGLSQDCGQEHGTRSDAQQDRRKMLCGCPPSGASCPGTLLFRTVLLPGLGIHHLRWMIWCGGRAPAPPLCSGAKRLQGVWRGVCTVPGFLHRLTRAPFLFVLPGPIDGSGPSSPCTATAIRKACMQARSFSRKAALDIVLTSQRTP